MLGKLNTIKYDTIIYGYYTRHHAPHPGPLHAAPREGGRGPAYSPQARTAGLCAHDGPAAEALQGNHHQVSS